MTAVLQNKNHYQGKRTSALCSRGMCCLARFCFVFILAASAKPAHAEFKFVPTAVAQYQQDSNVFYLPDIDTPIVGPNGPSRSDTVVTYKGGAKSTYTLGRQSLYVAGDVSRFQYKKFTQLDHNEYLASGAFNWVLSGVLDGLVDYSHQRYMASFLDATAAQRTAELVLETQKIGSANVNFKLAPDWRLETGVKRRETDSPLPNVVYNLVTETESHAYLRHAGIGALTVGLNADFIDGSFSGPSGDGPTYTQTTEQLALEYKRSDLSSLQLAVGYAQRNDTRESEKLSAVVGRIGYYRSLSAKTKLNLQVVRNVQTYVGSTSSTIDTISSVQLTWQATRKLSVWPSYAWTVTDHPPDLAAGTRRHDNYRYAGLDVNLQMSKWVGLRAYGRYQKRSSNFAQFQLSANSVGIALEIGSRL